MDTLGIEPSTPRMLSGCDNQLHHVPLEAEVKALNSPHDPKLRFWPRQAPCHIS